ncbi:ThiF family adenylyltransferase [Gracilibacillus kekensis]|uniref:Adenylyltransferase and sulfurtransferase n=1 Tax=Gracilibacillus kekensis TaxID=1027249 RepID=A0A1M7MPB7_9BACI|nr:ThiF family adenylyltransferase [Gracilibacillus kekensis]SHM92820.1 adenylyltransferase and sulfurtransferase [Gracilibacillus kekensis]
MSGMNRYHRQTLFAPIGQEGQAKLASKHVLMVGCGALGSSAAEMLTRAGVGELTLLDRDYVELTNLQRQHLFTEADVENKTPKAVAAASKLTAINSETKINPVVIDATADTMVNYVKQVDLIIDATDNFDTRFIINDLANKHQVPWIFGACVGSSGMTFSIIPGQTPCLDCLLKVTPVFGATCDAVGVIGPAVQMVVTHQTTEAIKILIEADQKIRTQLILFDLWHNHYQQIDVSRSKQENCKSCGNTPTYPTLSYNNRTKSEVLCGRETVQIRGQQYPLESLHTKLSRFGEVKANPFLVSVVIDTKRLVFFHDGRVFVHGTNSIEDAKKIYYQVVG